MDAYLQQIRRLSAGLFLFATVMVFALVNLPGVDHGNRVAIYGLLALAGLTGVAVWRFPWPRYDPNWFLVIGVSATVMIALLVLLSGGVDSIFFPLYAFVVVISGAYYGTRPLVFITAVSCIGAASYLIYSGPVSLALATPALALIAVLVAVAIVCHVMYRGLERSLERAAFRARFIEALHDVDLAILEERDEAEVLRMAADRTRELLHCDDAQIVVAPPDAVPDPSNRASSGEVRWRQIDAPLEARGDTIGSLTLIWHAGREPDSETTALARNFAAQIAIAVQDARLRRQAEQVRALTELARLKDEFIATASHELRTPLTALLGFSELLTRGRVNAMSQSEVYQRIHRSARQLSRLVDDLLDVSRLDGGHLLLDLETGDLVTLARQVATEMASVSPAHQIGLDVPVQPSCQAFDEKRVRQVLANLVTNAIRYSPDGGAITIGIRECSSEVAVTVQDEGIGIPRESLARVFEKFYRAPNATRTAEATGLGLAVCRGIVEAHGGRISAESDGEGRGSRFTFTLPRADNSVQSKDEREVEKSHAADHYCCR